MARFRLSPGRKLPTPASLNDQKLSFYGRTPKTGFGLNYVAMKRPSPLTCFEPTRPPMLRLIRIGGFPLSPGFSDLKGTTSIG